MDKIEYIEREAALENALAAVPRDDYFDRQIEFFINHIPAADVVEVVRCRDCARRHRCRCSNIWAVPPGDDWFCADGVRKEAADG